MSRTDTVRLANSTTFSDAFSIIPGMYISDNGGASGLKTASLRGMGSAHTAIYIDGVRVGNVQSGQADLGMPDLGNFSMAVVDYAQNSLSFITAKPVFNSRNTAGFIKVRGGSFGTCEPSARLDWKISEKICLSATVSHLASDGNFTLDDGSRRTNNDIRQERAGVDAWGTVRGGDWHLKGYFNGAERGTPGSVDWPSCDRQSDRNTFVQGVLRRQFSPFYMLNLSAKASYDELLYSSEYGDSRYIQKETQINSSHKFRINGWFDTSLSANMIWDELDVRSRASLFSSLCASFHPRQFKADFALEYSGTFDEGGKKRNVVSPSADMRWNVTDNLDLLAFARRSYRTPTFNELYYPGFGNPELRPEDAWLTDFGMEYNWRPAGGWCIQTKADAFFNYLKDKIISAPTESDPNIWLPYNIGIVQVKGIDSKVSFDYTGKLVKTGLSAQYSFQDAIDKTTEASRQVPYISRHTLSICAKASCRGWSGNLAWNKRAGRYDSAGPMPDYDTLDLTLGKDIHLPEGLEMDFRIYAHNLCDCRYCLVSGYPMPGRSFYAEIDFKF
ncbi:MAG: TonB-dependent receptor [Bacteroidales bacterium]|nr:TonB-dependent receptor [Candidatus Cryptobacteroides aphodequi]